MLTKGRSGSRPGNSLSYPEYNRNRPVSRLAVHAMSKICQCICGNLDRSLEPGQVYKVYRGNSSGIACRLQPLCACGLHTRNPRETQRCMALEVQIWNLMGGGHFYCRAANWTKLYLTVFCQSVFVRRTMHFCMHQSWRCSAQPLVIAIILVLLDLSYGATIPFRNALFTPLNVTTPDWPLNATSDNYRCSRSSDWVTPKFEASDCEMVIESFMSIEEKRHGHKLYDFTLEGHWPEHPSLVSQTMPREYKSGESFEGRTLLSCEYCGILIANLYPDRVLHFKTGYAGRSSAP